MIFNVKYKDKSISEHRSKTTIYDVAKFWDITPFELITKSKRDQRYMTAYYNVIVNMNNLFN